MKRLWCELEGISSPGAPAELPDTVPIAVPAFNNSGSEADPERRHCCTLSGQYHAFNIHEKYDTAVLRRWAVSIINTFPGTL